MYTYMYSIYFQKKKQGNFGLESATWIRIGHEYCINKHTYSRSTHRLSI
jgi:hypothetical protein